jgi:5-methylcytosine-specific restriction endonuclease McrA
MPISPENRKRYPKNWEAIRESILERAKHCCEWCKVPNYAVGYRDKNGKFVPVCGNGPVDAIGRGRTWPNESTRTTYSEAKEHADDFNYNLGDTEQKWIVIVLTIAHVHDDQPENCEPANLAALCQRCHNNHDAPARAKRRKEKRDQRQPTLL